MTVYLLVDNVPLTVWAQARLYYNGGWSFRICFEVSVMATHLSSNFLVIIYVYVKAFFSLNLSYFLFFSWLLFQLDVVFDRFYYYGLQKIIYIYIYCFYTRMFSFLTTNFYLNRFLFNSFNYCNWADLCRLTIYNTPTSFPKMVLENCYFPICVKILCLLKNARRKIVIRYVLQKLSSLLCLVSVTFN